MRFSNTLSFSNEVSNFINNPIPSSMKSSLEIKGLKNNKILYRNFKKLKITARAREFLDEFSSAGRFVAEENEVFE